MSMNLFPGAIGYLKIFRRHLGRRLYVILILTVVTSFLEGFGIALLVPLLSVLDTGTGNAGAMPAALRWVTDTLGLTGSLHGILLLIGGVFLFKAAVGFGASVYAGHVQVQLLEELKGRLFDGYSRMSYPYYASRDTGYFINIINDQVGAVFATFRSYKSFLAVIIRAATYLVIALWLTWQFAAMAVVVGGAVLLSFRRLNRYVRRLSVKTAKEGGHLNKLLVQVLQSFKYLASTHQMARLRGEVMSSIRRLREYQFRRMTWAAVTGSIAEPLTVFILIGIVIVQVSVLEQPIAPILVAILLFNRALTSIIGLQKGWQSIMGSIGSVEMVEDEFVALERHREPNGTRKIGPLTRKIELLDLSFCYITKNGDVLRDVTLTIPARTTVALVGESGAGKSTLVDLLTLLLKPRHGQLLIDGVPGTEVELGSWRGQIGYVSQETVVFDDTIAGNIALREVDAEKDPETFDRVVMAARRAYVDHFVREFPDGYDTVVGDRGIRLSGGQRQRLFIARELFKEPNLLILDEATSALDSDSERYIQESIDALKGSMTVVIIAHRLSTIKNADHVYVLDAGRVIEQGAYSELVDQPSSRFREMVELQRL